LLTLTEGWLATFGFLALLGLATGEGLLVGLGALVLITWVVAWSWNRASLARVSYERETEPTRAFIGESIHVRMRISNKKALPVPWVRVEESFPSGMVEKDQPRMLRVEQGANPITKATSLARYERVTWNFDLECRERGLFRFGPARVTSGDVFGFFTSERHQPGQTHVLVYPKTFSLPEIGIRPFGETMGGLPFYEDPTRLRALRDYTPNDPLRRVDWKATARSHQMKIRVFDPSVTQAIMIVQDARTLGRESGQWGYSPIYLERAVTVAASIARWGLEQRYGVGYATNSVSPLTDEVIRVPFSRSPDQLAAMLEALALVGPISRESIFDFIEQEMHRFPLGAAIVLVTASMNEESADAVREMRRAGFRPTVVWIGDDPIPVQIEDFATVFEIGENLAKAEQESQFRQPEWASSVGLRR
jgi:uncharacterized protein (DUF58 family)